MKIVAYTGRWCGPSTMLKSTLKREKIAFTSIDVEGSLKKAKEDGVLGTPTLIITDDTGKTLRIIGFNEDVLTRIQGVLESGEAV